VLHSGGSTYRGPVLIVLEEAQYDARDAAQVVQHGQQAAASGTAHGCSTAAQRVHVDERVRRPTSRFAKDCRGHRWRRTEDVAAQAESRQRLTPPLAAAPPAAQSALAVPAG
jgi:hypothetical protein